MKRELFAQLKAWKTNESRKPLVLMGVRQTGKTYLLNQFGAEEFRKTHYFNFEKQAELANIFQSNLDPKRIINELALYLDSKIDIEQDLVIFDEIQACAKALTSLKYFCEELPELALCSAGSLLGLTLNKVSYPVGKVDMMHLFPMTFIEFLQGIGEEQLTNYILQLTADSSPSIIAHEKLWGKLKLYFIVGGLPEVVAKFAALKDNLFSALQAARQKQEELINAYYADIAKHSGKVNAMHIDRVWRAIPSQLAQTQDGQAAKFKFKDVIPGINRYSRLVDTFDWLNSAELIEKAYILNTVQIPLSAYIKESQFKCFMFDVGILGAMANLNPKNILDYDYGTYKGYFAENFVSQELIAASYKQLYSWHDNRSEVEFLLENTDSVIPIEVKSGSIIKAESLKKYNEKYKPKQRIILSARNLKITSDQGLYQLPLYLAGRMTAFLDH